MKHSLIFSLIALSLLLLSCQSNERPLIPNYGTITYKIKYTEDISTSPSVSVLPEDVKLFFNNNKIKHEITGGFNFFTLDFFSLSPADSCHVMFKFMNKTMFYSMDPSNHFFLYERDGDVQITYFDDEPKTIAGFKCKKAQVNFEGEAPFYAYYTQDIDLINPNRNTPLADIPGLLMEFTVNYKGLKLEIIADKFNPKKPSSSEFKLPKKYDQSSKDKIDSMVSSLLENIK
jgi:GLPGLI family protein